jgi:chemosensory pili system protein ChpA (sensor histidine kinase/response regulator)
MDAVAQDDLSALAWVHDELRRTLEAAHKSMRRFLRETESTYDSDVDAVEPAVLRNARQQLHQGVGALELVGLPGAAALLRGSETALQRFVAKPQKFDLAAVDIVEQASFALLDFLGRRLAGKAVSPLALFPQYRAVHTLAGTERIHPADLWSHDWRWRDLPPPGGTTPRRCDATARAEVEALLLAAMRGDRTAGTQLAALCDALAAGAGSAHARTLWTLAAAFFEAQSQTLLKPDNFSKRVASKLLAQARAFERRADAEVPERLAQDLLFFCAQAQPGPAGAAPRLDAVRSAYGLSQLVPVDYEEARLGRFDPALVVQARKRVNGAKDAWSAVAGGELMRFNGLAEQFSLVGDSLHKLQPGGEALAAALQDAVEHTIVADAAPPPALAMEVATAMLYVEASLETAEFDHPEQQTRVRRLAERVAQAQAGGNAGPLEPWMEELYRRVSDRQTMGSVVQELRASLTEVEKHIDPFFRKPDDRNVLIPVPGQLAAMRGVLSVLGMDAAAQAVARMRSEIDAIVADPAFDAAAASAEGRFERLAGNLGALGFLIDMLSVQPHLAKSLFVFDPAAGTLSPVMGRSAATDLAAPAEPAPVQPHLVEQALSLAVSAASDHVPLADVARDLDRIALDVQASEHGALARTLSDARRSLAAAGDDAARSVARGQIAEAMADFVASVSEPPAALQPPPAKMPPPAKAPPASARPPAATGLEDDDEMRGVFLEEAREVVTGAHDALAALAGTPDDIAQLTTVRRAFHTLKGSSRMVGLSDFGEAAWACEQLYNARLADAPRADDTLTGFTGQALAYLAHWVDAIAARRDGGHRSADVRAGAEALRNGTTPAPLMLPSAGTAGADDALQPLPLVFETSHPAPLDAVEPARAERAGAAAEAPDFSLDLRGLDEPAPEPVAAQPMVVADSAPPSDTEPPVDDVIEATRPLPLLREAVEVPAPPPSIATIDLHLPLDEPAPGSPVAADPAAPEPEPYKQVGPLRISIPLFNIFLNEADELSRRLATELAEWSHETHRPVAESAVALAHSLGGNSATVGFTELSQLSRALEHALMRSAAYGHGNADEARLFGDAAEDMRRLLHQFAAGFLRSPAPALLERLAAHEADSARRAEALAAVQDDATPPLVDDEPAEVQAFEIPTGIGATDEALQPQLAPLAALGQTELKQFAPLVRTDEPAPHASADAPDDADDIDAIDAVDVELFPIFEEEGQELLPQLAAQMRDWLRRPTDSEGPSGCMRTLHTLKGGARLAGAMRLGEMAHRLETAIEHLLSRGDVDAADIDTLQGRVDALMATFEALRQRDAAAYAQATAQAEAAQPPAVEAPAVAPAPEADASLPSAQAEPALVPVVSEAAPLAADAPEPPAATVAKTSDDGIDWARFAPVPAHASAAPSGLLPERRTGERAGASAGAVRVRAPLLERLVNHAGEVSIHRSRIEGEVAQLRASLVDLTDNLERLRTQLRDIELQAETQISSRMEAARQASQSFDPLEMDRFTRFQELTRMMAESVNDVATVQRALTKTLQSAEDELAAQARLTRDMQDDLLRTRMVEFEGLSDRLYRVVRQAAKETGKQVRLDIVGGAIEIDRGVLERMTPAFEHLLRNCVTHGIELPAARSAAGKDATGAIEVRLSHEGNEVAVEFRDDGAGLNLPKVRERGLAMGLIEAQAEPTEAELANLIFHAGFSTAETVTELAGRGVGMDVVRAEVNAMGGRIETATAAGQGTSFKLVLPLTTAVTQVVMMRCGGLTVAVPSSLVEIVRRAKVEELDQAYASGIYLAGERALPFFWLGSLLQDSARGSAGARTSPVLVIRSAQQRVALHVDEVLGNQEVVVKNLGPQLAKLPGLAGMTLLASGAVALIYNPVALATLYGDTARAWTRASLAPVQTDEPAAPSRGAGLPAVPLVMVVDDSLTVRRVTQRLLVREGYRVVVAKDGLDALEKLADERPAVLLSDIEMPRMDGFDLARNVRADARLADLPIVMITSRIAQKHRDVAAELGVDHYLGKPYAEEDLLALVAKYAAAEVPA